MSSGTVYRALAADGTVLYVGMTTRIEQRLKEHAARSAWWPLHDRIERDEPRPLDEAFAAEADQIVLLRPSFNRTGGHVDRFGPDETTEREALAWKSRYEAGATIEEIALDARVSAKTVRKHLDALGTAMRRPGPRSGKAHLNVANRRAEDSGAVVRMVFGGARATHRRRGGKRAA